MKPEQLLGWIMILPAAATAFWGSPEPLAHFALAVFAGVGAALTWNARWGWSAALVAGLAPLGGFAPQQVWWLAAPLAGALIAAPGHFAWLRPAVGLAGLGVFAAQIDMALLWAVLAAAPFLGLLGWAATRHPPTWATQDNALRASLIGTGALLFGAGIFVPGLVESAGTRDGLAMLAIGVLAGMHGIAWTVAARAQAPPLGVWITLPAMAAVAVAWTLVQSEIPTKPMLAILLALGSIQVAPAVGLVGRKLPMGVGELVALLVAGAVGLLLHG